MRFSHIAMVYFFIGVCFIGAGVISPGGNTGLVEVWVDNPADPSANDDNIEGDGGILNNILGPIKGALSTVAGGTVLAVWGALGAFPDYYAWPITVSIKLNAPYQVTLIASALTAAFTFGLLRVIKGSI